MNNARFLFFFLLVSIFQVTCFSYARAAQCSIPDEAQFEDIEDVENVSMLDQVVGTGTPESCTSAAFVSAVALGGFITFNCGPDPITIVLKNTAKIFNDQDNPKIVIDGGNVVTLSGGGSRRILYMNTCDEDQNWTTSHCQNQDHPELTLQNLTFADGNSQGETEYDGGGAVWVRGGRLKILHCRFVRNKCAMVGPDVGGAAVRVLSQYENRPVYVVDSVFGGNESDGNIGSNGGGLSSIGVSFTVINSLFSHNQAVGNGGNPAESGTPGGGSGAAIYNDGNEIFLNVCGTAIHDNHANQHGGSIFFVSNNGTGNMYIENSGLWNNYLHHWLTHTGGISYKSDYRTPTFTNCFRSDDVIINKYTAIDVNGDEKIGLAEINHALETLSSNELPEISAYARKLGDIDYNHEVDLLDVIEGLQIITGANP